MAAKLRNFAWVAGVILVLVGGAITYVWFAHRDQTLPYINEAGLRKLVYFDQQIAIEQGRGGVRRTDVEFVVALVAKIVERGKLTGDGRDFDNAIGVLDEAEVRIAARTRTENGVTQIPELYAARARVMVARHRFLEAAQIAEKALRKYPQESALSAIAGEAAVQLGDMQTAEAYLRKLVNNEPRIPNNLIGLAHWAEIAGDLEQASELLARVPESNFPKPLPRLRLAYVFAVHGDVKAKGGKLEEARAYYQASLEQEPSTAQATVGLADLAQYQGKLDEAERLLRGLIDNEWPNAEYQAKLADVRELQGDAAEAKKLRRAAEKYFEWSVDTGFEGYLRPLALVKLKQGDFRAAGKYAARDLEIRPNRESRAVYQSIYDQAKAAGSELRENALLKLDAETAARKAAALAGS